MIQEKYLVTGASGFIGGRLYDELLNKGSDVIGLCNATNVPNLIACDLTNIEKLQGLLNGVTCIFHCAGYAHAQESNGDQHKENCWLVNYEGAVNLVDIAARTGVKKIINLSSVKAIGEGGNLCIDERYPVAPVSEYGKSKLAAENYLLKVGQMAKMHVVNLRIPLVYGRGSKGGILSLANFVKKYKRVHFGKVNNLRSVIHIEDLMDLMLLVSEDSRASGEIFIATGPQNVSTDEIVNQMRYCFGINQHSISVPCWFLRAIAFGLPLFGRLFGCNLPYPLNGLNSLIESAWYSSHKLEYLLGWKAKVNLQEGIKEMLLAENVHP